MPRHYLSFQQPTNTRSRLICPLSPSHSSSHKTLGFSGFFLRLLGRDFLKLFYRVSCRSDEKRLFSQSKFNRGKKGANEVFSSGALPYPLFIREERFFDKVYTADDNLDGAQMDLKFGTSKGSYNELRSSFASIFRLLDDQLYRAKNGQLYLMIDMRGCCCEISKLNLLYVHLSVV